MTEESKVALPMNVQDAMRENLPEQVGKLVRIELEKGAQAIAEVGNLRKSIEHLEAELDKHRKLTTRKKELDRREEIVADREYDVAAEARENVTFKLETRLQAEEGKTKFMRDVCMGLVRNTTYRESAFMNIDRNSGQYDAQGNQVPSGESTTVERTVE